MNELSERIYAESQKAQIETLTAENAKLLSERDKLKEQRDELTKTMEFYADQDNYNHNAPLDGNSEDFEGGDRAIICLQRVRELEQILAKEQHE